MLEGLIEKVTRETSRKHSRVQSRKWPGSRYVKGPGLVPMALEAAFPPHTAGSLRHLESFLGWVELSVTCFLGLSSYSVSSGGCLVTWSWRDGWKSDVRVFAGLEISRK